MKLGAVIKAFALGFTEIRANFCSQFAVEVIFGSLLAIDACFMSLINAKMKLMVAKATM